jgi:hypothetical protein
MSDYDRWLDEDLDQYYEEDEDLIEDLDWVIDKYVEDQIERESFDD